MGTDPNKEKEQADNLKLKRGLWKENDKEIRAELDELSKVKDIQMPTTKRDNNYLKEMTNTNARLLYKDNMACRECPSGGNETHEEKPGLRNKG